MKYLNIQDEMEYYKKLNQVKKRIEDVFLNKEYTEIQLSVFEDIEVKIDIYHKGKMESMAKVVNNNCDLVTLRLDNTTGILKKIIPKIKENDIIKLYYDSKVFRKDYDSNIKEIRQVGVECIGGNIELDKEIINMALDILDKFNGDFIIEISNSKFISGLIEGINLPDKDKMTLKELLYTKNKFELNNFLIVKNIEDNMKTKLISILDFQGNFKDIIGKAKGICINKKMQTALEEMEDLNDYIEELGYEKYIQYDFSMIMEFNYYDGLIFKGYYPRYHKDIIYGGRYDVFTEKFGKKFPAIGFCLNIDELTEIV